MKFGLRDISVMTEDGDIGLMSLSAGEKQVLLMLIEVLQARNGSMIVDEPELSLHLSWQRDLIRFLRSLNSNSQIIFATHSPEIMATIESDKIFHLWKRD